MMERCWECGDEEFGPWVYAPKEWFHGMCEKCFEDC